MFFAGQLAAAALIAVANAAPFLGTHCTRGQTLAESYDYVIVGGGAAGLTVANRLSEDSSVTVLVIEAGDFDQNEDYITIPGLAGGAIGTKYDWNTTYTPNPALNNRSVSIPQGRIVGGSTKLNRMVFDMGSKSDYDRWAELGNDGWGWDGLEPYFKKFEAFTPPTAEIVAEYGVEYDASAHGDSGPIDVTYSPFFWPLTKNIVEATKELGITIPTDQAAGQPIGGYFCPHNINSTKMTRSSAREAYYTPAAGRTNLHLITGQQVTRLLVDGGNGTATVTGVEYAASAEGARSTVSVGKEAIMAAGSIHTPAILQVSGIGASSLHQELGVATVVDLPAVGQNFQDHILLSAVATVTTDEVTSTLLSTNATFAADALAQYEQAQTGPYSTPTGDFLLFLPLTTYSNASASLASQAAAQDGTRYLPSDAPAEVVAGYRKEQALLNERLTRNDSAVLELIWDTGTLVLGLEHPFSRGTVRASSDSTFDMPAATPGYLANPLDLALMREALAFARRVWATDAVAGLSPVEVSPGANVTSDADVEAWVRDNAATLYHPVGSCKMGARGEGGVVDAELKVYGVGNLRVVDASVMPLLPATHIMTAVYGVAEKAADIIKGV